MNYSSHYQRLQNIVSKFDQPFRYFDRIKRNTGLIIREGGRAHNIRKKE